MNHEGIDAYAYMQGVAGRIDHTRDAQELDRMLDGLEYLFDILDPELQDLAAGLMQRLRDRLEALRSDRA